MRNRTTPVRLFGASTGVLFLALLAGGTGVADAAEAQVTPPTNEMSFGLLGPVGLAAVILGVVGMALGVVRQRRKAAQVPVEPEPAQDAARPALTPYQRPTA
ncbi:hypothetical protein FHX82_004538 [Amycolatopsis bartoniae]|uniref:Uncharacterized protein n=1 Tax=Amycolatopsis bartoniae TaxID=941986 RepID=A0A8H9J4N4_9PSEU|nr:hypothetical protein [Amycolatopsis bartoniae]GHF86962.1 hypothetical protein GCM10017566_71050 [Amycolatopsis bartoniae]